MTDVAMAKRAARKAAMAVRAAAQETADPAPALAALLDLLHGGPPGPVSGYLAIRTEIDPAPAMTALCADGWPVCVPVIRGAGLPLDFCEWRPGCALTDGPFGASVPEAGAWLTPAQLIVPLLAFDRAGFRLGYGGGFYDRTLAGLRAAGRPVRAIGLAFAAQECPAVPRQPTDEPLDLIVTENGVIRP
jgi:5-formyltetrahydrofolate cyclo-ligase